MIFSTLASAYCNGVPPFPEVSSLFNFSSFWSGDGYKIMENRAQMTTEDVAKLKQETYSPTMQCALNCDLMEPVVNMNPERKYSPPYGG